jgi:hypothetical protein
VNTQLKNENYKHAGELMEVPRLEETYLRKARGIVLEKERIVTQKDILLKSQQKDIEAAGFWQGKAKAYNEEIKLKNNEISSLKQQLTRLTHKHLSTLKSNETYKNDLKNMMTTGRLSLSSPNRPKSPQRQSRSRSPSPTVRKHYKSKENDSNTDSDEEPHLHNSRTPFGSNCQTDNTQTNHKPFSKNSNNIHKDHSEKQPSPVYRNKEKKKNPLRRRMSAIEVAASNKNPLEIQVEKLKENNEILQKKLDKVNKALAISRAYPLYNMGSGMSNVDSDDEQMNNNGIKKPKLNEQEQLDELFDSEEDREELENGYLPMEEENRIFQAEQLAQQERISRAVSVSTAYKAKLQALRQSRPGVQHLKKMRDKQEAEELSHYGTLF